MDQKILFSLLKYFLIAFLCSRALNQNSDREYWIQKKGARISLKGPFQEKLKHCFIKDRELNIYKSLYCYKKHKGLLKRKAALILTTSKKRKASVFIKNQGLVIILPIRNWGLIKTI